MSITIPVQTRLDTELAKAIDARAAIAGSTRAEVVRGMIEAALANPQSDAGTTTEPLLDRIADTLGALAAKVDASLAASRNAHAAARLGALMMLPADKQAAFIEKLGKAAQP